jgi:hypothetical protein
MRLDSMVHLLDGLLFMCDAFNPSVKLRFQKSPERGSAVFGSEGARVLRVSYNSPLEVVLEFVAGVSGGVGIASLAANRVVSVYKNVQEARKAKAGADLQAYIRDLVVKEFEFDDELISGADPYGLRLDGAVKAISAMTTAATDDPGK